MYDNSLRKTTFDQGNSVRFDIWSACLRLVQARTNYHSVVVLRVSLFVQLFVPHETLTFVTDL